MKLRIKKYQIYQISFAVINVIITIIIPIVTYLNFKSTIRSFNCPDCPESIVNQIHLGGMEAVYDILIYVFVFVGLLVTVCSYFINRFQKYSIQRGILMLIISIVYFINIIFSSQMSTITIKIANIQLVIKSFGIFILFIVITLLYVLKALFDLVDFKVNKLYYNKIIRREQATKIRQRKLIKQKKLKLVVCPKCNYTCRTGWKKCPICEAKIQKFN